MKDQGKFKMQAHQSFSVVMDIAAFKVGHSVGCDIDATALQAARARSSFIGAMDNSSREVQNASAHCQLRTHIRQHTVNSAGQWRDCLGRFKICKHSPTAKPKS